jgi:hypothetical protein
MDMEEAGRILNMELLGLTPDDFGHVRILNGPELARYVTQTDDEPDYPDETADTQRNYTLTIAFDAATDLEARLAFDALVGFARRRLNLTDPVFTAHLNEGATT